MNCQFCNLPAPAGLKAHGECVDAAIEILERDTDLKMLDWQWHILRASIMGVPIQVLPRGRASDHVETIAQVSAWWTAELGRRRRRASDRFWATLVLALVVLVLAGAVVLWWT